MPAFVPSSRPTFCGACSIASSPTTANLSPTHCSRSRGSSSAASTLSRARPWPSSTKSGHGRARQGFALRRTRLSVCQDWQGPDEVLDDTWGKSCGLELAILSEVRRGLLTLLITEWQGQILHPQSDGPACHRRAWTWSLPCDADCGQRRSGGAGLSIRPVRGSTCCRISTSGRICRSTTFALRRSSIIPGQSMTGPCCALTLMSRLTVPYVRARLELVHFLCLMVLWLWMLQCAPQTRTTLS